MVSLKITYDTARNSLDPKSYTVDFSASSLPGSLLQSDGPTFNNTVRLRGIYGTEAEAIAAALGYIHAQCRIVALEDGLAETTRYLRPAARRENPD